MVQRNLWWWCILVPSLAMMPLFMTSPKDHPWVPTVFMALVLATLIGPILAGVGVWAWARRQRRQAIATEAQALWGRLGVGAITRAGAPSLCSPRPPKPGTALVAPDPATLVLPWAPSGGIRLDASETENQSRPSFEG